MSHGRPWTTMEQRANAHGHGSRFVHGSCTDGGVLYCLIGGRHRWTIGRQFWLYHLYYPLCVSRRIDTWQVVYLSYKEPCPAISIHKRYIHVPWVHPWPVPIQRANAHGHGSCTSTWKETTATVHANNFATSLNKLCAYLRCIRAATLNSSTLTSNRKRPVCVYQEKHLIDKLMLRHDFQFLCY